MLNSTDKFLVNDGSVTETVNWSDIQSEAFPMTVNVVLTPDEPEVGEEVTATPVTVGGDHPYTYTYQWVTADDALGLNQTDIVGATSNTYTPVSADTDKFLGCVVVSTDDAGNSASGVGYATTAVVLALVIAKPTVLTPEDGAGIGGDINYFPETSAITSVDVDESAGFEVMPGNQRFQHVIFANGRFVAVGSGGSNPTQSMVSTDGENWTVYDGVFGNENRSNEFILYGADMFLVGGSKGSSYSIATSPDGVAWTPRMITGNGAKDFSWGCGAYNGSVFILGTSSGTSGQADYFLTSPDGINWSSGYAANSNMRFADGHLAANPTTGTIIALNYNTSYDIVNRSTDNGASFQSNTQLNGSSSWDDLTFADGIFAVKKRSSDQIYTSRDDGLTWSRETTRLPASPGGGAFGYANGRWMFVGQGFIYYSDDLTSWETVEQEENIRPTSFAYGNGVFWEMGAQATHSGEYGMGFSPDGITWDAYTVLNLTNNKAFNSADGTEITTIDKAFKAGDKVVGNGDVTVFADSPAFSIDLYNASASDLVINNGIDNTFKSLVWIKIQNYAGPHQLQTQIEPGSWLSLRSHQTNAGSFNDNVKDGTSTGYTLPTARTSTNNPSVNSGNNKYVAWNFRGAPGFFDVVTYEGSGATQEVPHSLGSAPGMMIVKCIDSAYTWTCYHKEVGAGYYAQLNGNSEFWSDPAMWDNTEPTDKVFTVGAKSEVNNGSNNYKYVAYLFADTPGLIKCGLFDGTGGQVSEDVGFKPGWILYKRSDSTGSWMIWDLERGNGSSSVDIPTLFPNDDRLETATSRVELTDTGFTIYEGGSTNTSGGKYIYVAIVENASAGEFFPTGVLTEDAAGTSMTLTDVTGTWAAGLTAVNETEATEHAPGADDIVFTSSQPAITSGSVNSWGAAEWELSVDSGFVDKQESSVFLADSNPELGPTNFILEDDTEYWVRTRYNSADPVAVSEWSESTKFKTAGISGGAFGNFSTTLYAGNGGGGGETQVIDTGVDNTVKSLLWIKSTDFGTAHNLFDTERGADLSLSSNGGGAERSFGGEGIKTFDSSGFTLGSDNSYAELNKSGRNYVAWNFASGAGFFDVVTYPGDASQPQNIPHSLGVAPGLMIVKSYDDTTDWIVYHKELGATKTLKLNDNSAERTSSNAWNNTEPTDTVFTVGPSSAATNNTNWNYVAYLFADNPDGGIKCGTFTGGGEVANPIEVDCGFKAGWVMWKRADGTASGFTYDWQIFDAKRGLTQPSPQNNPSLLANSNAAEASNARFYATDNGFAHTESLNDVGKTGNFIYIAIADTTVQFYDENTASTVTNHTLTKRYGVDPLTTDLKKYGIFPLTEQPNYAVAAYVRENGHYKPIRSYLSEVNRANQTISDMQASFEARIAALESGE